MTEIAILVILAAAAAWGYNFYLKPKKDLDNSATPKGSDAPADTHKAAETSPATAKPVVSVATQTAPVENSAEPAEEDMLKRHHLHNLRVMLVSTTFPQPTDSTLSRHYDEMIDAKAEDCLNDETKMARLVADYEACQNAELAGDRTALANADTAEPQKVCCQRKRCAVPEDSALKRHYLAMLRVNIAKNYAPRPADSALRRHYDAMIDAELKTHFACH